MKSSYTQFTVEDLFNYRTDGFRITNPLLLSCMGAESATHIPQKYRNGEFHGFRNHKETIGYIFLCRLVYKAFNLSRELGSTDRIFADLKPDSSLLEKYKSYAPFYDEEEENAIEELRNLYQHTQNKLSQHFNENNPLILKRVISDQHPGNYMEVIRRLYLSAKTLGHHHIPLDMDTLNSYQDISRIAYTTPNRIEIRHRVNIADVLYCAVLISNFGLIEWGEWVVINRNSNGLVHLPLDSISFFGVVDKVKIDLSREAMEKIWNNGLPITVRFPTNFTHPNVLQTYSNDYTSKAFKAQYPMRSFIIDKILDSCPSMSDMLNNSQ